MGALVYRCEWCDGICGSTFHIDNQTRESFCSMGHLQAARLQTFRVKARTTELRMKDVRFWDRFTLWTLRVVYTLAVLSIGVQIGRTL